MDLPMGFLVGFGEGFDKTLAINFVQEDVLPAVPPAHNVINRAGIFDSYFPGHEGESGRNSSKSQHEQANLWFDPFNALCQC